MKKRNHLIIVFILLLTLILSAGTGISVFGDVIEFDINSGAERNGEFISANEIISAKDGFYQVIMTGLKPQNADAILKTIGDNYVPYSTDALRIVDEALPDAEKWDCTLQTGEYEFDVEHCWAASASNMLWISGWAQMVNNPETGAPFTSEDEVFRYYTSHFSDGGGEIDRGIDWFFMGEYMPTGVATGAGFLFPDDSSQGLMKSFFSPLAQQQINLVGAPEGIASLERLDQTCEDPVVVQGGVGSVLGDEVDTDYSHSVTIAGVICDPDKTDLRERYKAVIIIDSDNDGSAGYEPAGADDPPAEQKYKERAERPNTYTVYNLKYCTDINGTDYWEILGYSDKAPQSLSFINLLKLPSDSLISECTETEGTADAFANVDFTIDLLFTTGNDESIHMPSPFYIEDALKTVFSEDEAVNLNYFLTNRTNIPYDEKYAGFGNLEIGWEVIRKSDASAVAGGSVRFRDEIFGHSDIGALIHLNEKDGKTVRFEPGDYTVRITLNADRAVTESYYRNNAVKELSFTVTKSEGSSGGNSEDPEQITPTEPEPETVSLQAPKISVKAKDYTKKNKKMAVTLTKVKGAKYYKVFWRKAGAKKWSSKKITGTSCTIKNMKTGALYQFKAHAYDGGGKSSKASKTLYRYYSKTGGVKIKTKKKAAVISFKKDKKASGYKVLIAENKNMKNAETITLKGRNKTSYTVKNLKKGRRYYVTVRPYKTQNGKTYTGIASGVTSFSVT